MIKKIMFLQTFRKDSKRWLGKKEKNTKRFSFPFFFFWRFCRKFPFSWLRLPIFLNFLLLLFWSPKGRGELFAGFFKRGFLFRSYSRLFFCFCLSIGSCVILFRIYYIPLNELKLFSLSLMVFILFILLLTGGKNILRTFLGWEGVGILSFLLISWFSSREEAVRGAKKAVLFNRGTDFFFLILILFELGELRFLFNPSTGENFSISLFFFSQEKRILTMFRGSDVLLLILRLSFFFRTAGKSAQFLFHPWLTAAIEGPTPVSRLLHRRTMVVAGVYLIFNLHSYLDSLIFNNTLLMILSSSFITLLRASIWAFRQSDIKKIVALSTTRQLRFIIILICLGFPDLAFFHIIIHGYFKALIFIGRGIGIHSRLNLQDTRKIGLPYDNNYLKLFFILGNFGLIGIPFLGASFRKHLLFDQWRNFQHQINYFVIIIFLLSAGLTLGYSLKTLLIFYKNVPNIHFPPLGSFWQFQFLGKIYPTFFLRGIVFCIGPITISFFSQEGLNIKRTYQSGDFLTLCIIGLIRVSLINWSNFNLTFFFSGILMLKTSGFLKIRFKIFFSFLKERFQLKKNLKYSRTFFFFKKKENFPSFFFFFDSFTVFHLQVIFTFLIFFWLFFLFF